MVRSLKGLYHLLTAIFAVVWFRFPSRKLTVIGVTGTDGKTTTTTLIYEILKANGFKTSMITSVHAVIAGKSYDTGFHVTTPTAFYVQKYLREAVDAGDTHMVLEVTSHGLAQHRVLGVKFAVGVLTNVTHEHLDWHKTLAHYLQTKLSLLVRAQTAVVNKDDTSVFGQILKVVNAAKLVTYGTHTDAKVTPKTHPFTTKLPGEFNAYNCLAALAAAVALGVDKKVARTAIAAFAGVPGRMEIVVDKPFQVIVDFAHTPNAITQALKTARASTKKRLIHVFGSAGLRDSSKRPLMGKASAQFSDVIILTEEDYRTEDVHVIMKQIASDIPKGKKVYQFPDREEAIRRALALAGPGDCVMITGKGHEKSLCRGTIEYSWSDQEAVRRLINERKNHS